MGFFTISFLLICFGLLAFWRFLPELAQIFLRQILPLLCVLIDTLPNKSLLNKNSLNKKIVYRHDDGFYWCLNAQFALQYDEKKERPSAAYRWKTDPNLSRNCLTTMPIDTLTDLLQHTRAVIQTFNYDMLHNTFY
jgi:hypothetical protein